eukprot:GHVL01024177.1.p1 GENE.GHVL01024177.1~~GHVL01024177.1.p1  ORF type:complete len:402 (-),score=65.22 GHVL01024177.1:896-2101(-)
MIKIGRLSQFSQNTCPETFWEIEAGYRSGNGNFRDINDFRHTYKGNAGKNKRSAPEKVEWKALIEEASNFLQLPKAIVIGRHTYTFACAVDGLTVNKKQSRKCHFYKLNDSLRQLEHTDCECKQVNRCGCVHVVWSACKCKAFILTQTRGVSNLRNKRVKYGLAYQQSGPSASRKRPSSKRKSMDDEDDDWQAPGRSFPRLMIDSGDYIEQYSDDESGASESQRGLSPSSQATLSRQEVVQGYSHNNIELPQCDTPPAQKVTYYGNRNNATTKLEKPSMMSNKSSHGESSTSVSSQDSRPNPQMDSVLVKQELPILFCQSVDEPSLCNNAFLEAYESSIMRTFSGLGHDIDRKEDIEMLRSVPLPQTSLHDDDFNPLEDSDMSWYNAGAAIDIGALTAAHV